jgi:hypothetical protein
VAKLVIETAEGLPAGRELDVAVAQALLAAQPDARVSLAGGIPAIALGHAPTVTVRWRPSTFPVDALHAAEMMHARGYWLELHSPFMAEDTEWWAGFTPLATTGFNGRPDHTARGATPALAICRAILKVFASAEPPLSDDWDATAQEIILGAKNAGEPSDGA